MPVIRQPTGKYNSPKTAKVVTSYDILASGRTFRNRWANAFDAGQVALVERYGFLGGMPQQPISNIRCTILTDKWQNAKRTLLFPTESLAKANLLSEAFYQNW